MIVCGASGRICANQGGTCLLYTSTEMAAISLGVAVISFVIGLIVKQCLGIDV